MLDQALIPLLTRMYIGHDVTAPRKELKGHDYSVPLLEIIIINAKVECRKYSAANDTDNNDHAGRNIL